MTTTKTYILEVQRLYPNLNPEENGEYKHVSCMNICFGTEKDAANYYNFHNPHMRKLDRSSLISDRDPITNLRYVITRYHGQHKSISPF